MAYDWKERLEIYDTLVAKCPDIKRKGKTVPYTSDNGYMFSLVNKDGEIGIRFSKEEQERLMDKHQTTLFKSHGATMKGYILITDEMLEDLDMVAEYLIQSQKHVMTLAPK